MATTTTDKVLDTTAIAYIRSRKINFSASGFKPNSKVYAFFDGTSVSDYVRQENTPTSYVSAPDNTKYTGYTSHPDGATDLIADNDGIIYGSFLIPYNDSLKFFTGDRTFRLIDNALNDTAAAYTYADVTYSARGVLEKHQRTIVTTATPAVVSTAAPVSTPYQAPARPSVSISVQGRSPKWVGIPWNFTANATSSTTGGVISQLKVFGRSGNPSASTGTWVQIGGSSPNAYSAELIARDQANLVGQYQWKAVATINGVDYESGYITLSFADLPPELIGVSNDGSSLFYN